MNNDEEILELGVLKWLLKNPNGPYETKDIRKNVWGNLPDEEMEIILRRMQKRNLIIAQEVYYGFIVHEITLKGLEYLNSQP